MPARGVSECDTGSNHPDGVEHRHGAVEWPNIGAQQGPWPDGNARPGTGTNTGAANAPNTHGGISDTQRAGATTTTVPQSARSALSTTVTTPGESRHRAVTRSNPNAEDLLDHWGHRRADELADALVGGTPTGDEAQGKLERVLQAARAHAEGPGIPALLADDTIRPLGAHAGIAYGRWSGGPADTLSIEFTYEEASPGLRDNHATRAMVDRAGKMWSRRIGDTWTSWTTTRGEETVESTGLEISFIDQPGLGSAGKGGSSGGMPHGVWQPRFGTVWVDRAYLASATETSLFSTLTHEIGHVLGAWRGFDEYTDKEAGTWTGPNVKALHGGVIARFVRRITLRAGKTLWWSCNLLDHCDFLVAAMPSQGHSRRCRRSKCARVLTA